MKVVEKSYNVLTIDVGEMTSGVAKVIGTNQDYLTIKKITGKSGILRVKAVLAGLPVYGTMAVNPWQLEDKLELTCVTYAGDTLQALIGCLEPSNDGCKATVTVNALS